MEINDSVGAGGRNAVLKAHTLFFSKSVEAEMTGPLYEDIFQHLNAIPQITRLEVKLTPSKDSFMLMSGAFVTGQAPHVQ